MPAYAPAVGAVLLVCSLTTGLTGCAAPQKSVEKSAEEIEEVTEAAPLPESASSPTAAVTATAKATVPAPQPDYFREGVNTATSAVSIGQTAQSQDDWKLAAARWRKAIADLQKVPADSPNHALAQQKIKEYQQHLISAEASAAGKTASPAARIAASVASDGRKATIPIVGRRGGIPLVSATMQGQNGKHTFEMLFDTGASGTLITPSMANTLGVVVVGEVQVTIADGSVVALPIGYLDFIEVGGLRQESITVAIGGDVALLGQDFYGAYGLAINQDSIALY